MEENENPSLEEIRKLLEASQDLHFHAEGRQENCGWVDRTSRAIAARLALHGNSR